jgi:hypothetical protein
LDWKNYLVCIIKATQTKAYTFHEDETSTGSMKITYAHVTIMKKQSMQSGNGMTWISTRYLVTYHLPQRMPSITQLERRRNYIYLASHACISLLLVDRN